MAAEFDAVQFETLMARGVQLHNEREYGLALDASTEAYELAPDYSMEKGRAARDNAARCDRLGRAAIAELWAQEAYGIHNVIVHDVNPPREAYREFAASALYLGVTGIRKVIATKLSPTESPELEPSKTESKRALEYADEAWSAIRLAKQHAPAGINQRIDQYEINAARRVAIARSLLGGRYEGLTPALQAVRLGFYSESRRLDTTNHDLARSRQLRAKAKAVSGGAAALGVALLSSSPKPRTQRLVYRLADRAF